MILVAFCIAYVIKPAYMLLALGLIRILRGQTAPDMAALRRALAAFAIGDGCCWINFLWFADRSPALEVVHDLGMAASISLAAYALCAGLDTRILRLSHPHAPCAALPLCRACIKHEPVPCGLRRAWRAVLAALLLLSPLPLWTRLGASSYTMTGIGGTYSWSDSRLLQALDTRGLPLLAAALLAGSLAALSSRRRDAVAWAKILFAAGAGPLAFGFLRVLLIALFRENLLWYAFWEDATELLSLLAVAYMLWTFRRGLFSAAGAADQELRPAPAAWPIR